MTIKNQLMKIKENWLLVVLIVVLFIFMSGGTSLIGNFSSYGSVAQRAMVAESESIYASKSYIPSPGSDFAPEVEERKITKTSSISNEVKRGKFHESESQLKAIITSTDSFLLNENVNKYGSGINTYYQGTYQIKVETEKYDAVITQLKDIGEVKSFNENARDITGRYTDIETELEAETARLARYMDMYKDAKEVSDKIELNDRIFNQERRVKYLEEALESMDQKIDYSTISATLREKQSGYAGIALVKLSELVKRFVSSVNSLLTLVVVLLPYAIALLILRFCWKWFKKKRF